MLKDVRVDMPKPQFGAVKNDIYQAEEAGNKETQCCRVVIQCLHRFIRSFLRLLYRYDDSKNIRNRLKALKTSV